MGKFSNAVAGQQKSALGKLAAQSVAELPTGPQEVEAEVAAPVAAPVQAPTAAPVTEQDVALAATPEQPTLAPEAQQRVDNNLQSGITEGFDAIFAEEARQSIPDLRTRWRDSNPVNKATASAKVDGGIFSRANNMAGAVEKGELFPAISLANTPGFNVAKEGGTNQEVADAIAQEKTGSLIAAVNRAGAVTNTDPRNPQFDPDYIKAASMVTENMLFELATGARDEIATEADPISQAIDEAPAPERLDSKPISQIAKAQANPRIGQQIHQEFQRLKGVPVPDKLPPAEAETVGDAFKEMWAMQNPELVKRTKDPKTNQVYLELTPLGETTLTAGTQDRKRLFPNKNVKPSKTPLVTGKLLGDTGANVVKNVQGAVGKQEFGKVLQESGRNMGQIPNVVNKQRSRILYSTVLPVVQKLSGNVGPEVFNSWEAEINNIGAGKLAKYQAAEAQSVETGEAYNAMEEMKKAVVKLGREVQSIAENRKGANYFSYATQGFQGRQSPQQTYFNATTSKAVRFVTTNAVPAVAKPGSRVEANLRQMYAMMLVKGADGKLPDEREIMLNANSGKLEAWGDKLTQAIQMTDAEADAISEALENKIQPTDPNFPQVKPMALDPEADAELIAAIKSKGEDGPHFIDGLLDYSQYIKKKRVSQPHSSYFNAYIDGKTNGIASNGIQMGNIQTAERTGVIRNTKTDYLDVEGDVRDVLKADLLEMVDRNGFEGHMEGFQSEMAVVAKSVFSHRDLNKKTTMTFGYGKEIDTFVSDMADTMALFKADPNQIKDPVLRDGFKAAIEVVEQNMKPEVIADTLMTFYAPALEGVMSPEALAARSVMRSSAIMHAATNQLMSIKSYTGMDMNFGRDMQEDYSEADISKYRLRGEKVPGGATEFTAASRKSTPSSAAERTRGGNTQAGEFAYGGSVVGPVQSLDAATVAMSTAGKSWKRMQAASGGNAYMHTIYDAFKVDANGYDVALEEINENWLEAAMNWSYLKETQTATTKAMQDFRQDMSTRKDGDALSVNERVYMDFLMAPVETASGKEAMINFVKKVGTAGSFQKRGIDPWKEVQKMQAAMKSVGYDWERPPETATVAQLKMFVNTLNHILAPEKRLAKAVEFTEKNKKKLKAEILKRGYKTKSGKSIALQYYAH